MSMIMASFSEKLAIIFIIVLYFYLSIER